MEHLRVRGSSIRESATALKFVKVLAVEMTRARKREEEVNRNSPSALCLSGFGW
jgi:hypothetical protein